MSRQNNKSSKKTSTKRSPLRNKGKNTSASKFQKEAPKKKTGKSKRRVDVEGLAFKRVIKKKKEALLDEIELTPDRDDDNLKSAINWFPGHMLKAMKQIREKLRSVDIVVEIRDARAPLLTGNEALHEILGEKSKLIIINKAQFADPHETKKWEKYFQDKSIHYVVMGELNKSSLKEVTEKVREILHAKWEISGAKLDRQKVIKMMMIGLPNTGKSTIINSLAGRPATRAADRPGLTQSQQWVKLQDDIDLLDTPGIMPPHVENEEQGLWLSAIHAVKDEILGEDAIACFIIKEMMKRNSTKFFERYKLEEKDYDLFEVIDLIARNRNFVKQGGHLDYNRMYTMILSDFRDGLLGTCTFEKC